MKHKIIALAAAVICSASFANDRVTFIVGYPAGGDTDVLTRIFAQKYGEMTGKTVVVENKVGASGAIATTFVRDAAPDGSVIMLTPSTHVTAPLIQNTLPYDPVTDVTPIMQLSGHGMFIAISAQTGVKNIADLRKAYSEGKVTTYGSAGAGTPMHVIGEMFNESMGTQFTHIPFKGNAPVVTAMLGNHVPMSVITLLPVIPHVNTGKLNLVGIASAKRSPFFPDVPTLAEQGVKGVEVDSWLGFVGPKNMPNDVVRELNANFNTIISMPDVQEKLKSLAMSAKGGKPADFAATIKRDYAKFSVIVKKFDIKAN